jgi:hypothetical protein
VKAVGSDKIEIWFADEARIGQKNKITRRWAKRGTRPSAPRDQRTASTYIFGAVCPKQGKGAALILPACNTEAGRDGGGDLHQVQVHRISVLWQEYFPSFEHWRNNRQSYNFVTGRYKSDDAHHKPAPTGLVVPPNITIMALPPKCPELNPVENVWQFLRDNWLSNRVFKSYDDLVDHCCVAWNKLVNQPWRIMSIGLRQWAHRF